ncbi:MAG TPA: tyrosine-type recombinase/integrase [Pedococcus sp.]|nr:tyrosine-type recombinase/integrase [Pedococcus sp.]
MATIGPRRADGTYRARYRDRAGREHARHFKRKLDAQRWLDEVTTSIITRAYVAPGAGRITFREYAEGWRVVQVHRYSTAVHVEGALRRRVYPVIGDIPLESIVPSDIQALVKRLEQTLAPRSVIVTYRYVATIFKAAVRDRRIALTPCDGIRLPRDVKAPITPMATSEVQALVEAIPERYKAMVILAAGTGMRQGEIFGVTLDRVDFLRRTLFIDRQLTGVRGEAPTFGPPKTASSVRTVPLPDVVLQALAEHVRHFPPGPHGVIFSGSDGQLLRRSAFGNLWRRVNDEAGVKGRTFHSLRHYYASLLIRHGESVKTVQARLGHASAAETLDTYSHLWPDSDDKTREAVDAYLGTARSQESAAESH